MPKTLGFILEPVSLSEFRDKHYAKQVLHIAGRPEKFETLFTWDSLNRVLNSAPFPNAALHLVIQGRTLSATDADKLVEHCRNGATLIVGDVQRCDAKLGEFTASLSSEIGELCRINLYLSQPERQGYNRHYDTHDVFVLQISGSKGWRIYDMPLEYPLWVQKSHATDPPDALRLECTLKAGDVLYIPRGHWHEAAAQTEPSLHLTLGIYARTGVDFATWLVDELREDARWREAAPLAFRDEDGSPDALPPARLSYLARLQDLLVERLSRQSLAADYHRFCVAQDRSPRRFYLPKQIFQASIHFDERTTFMRPEYQRVSLKRRGDVGETEVVVWGKVLRFTGPAERLLRFILATTIFSGRDAREACPEASWEDIVTILRTLVYEGVLDIAES